MENCKSAFWPFSSDNAFASCCNSVLTWASESLRPASVAVRNACASTNTSSTKIITISSVDSAST